MAVALISLMMIRLVKLYYAQRPRARSWAYKNGAEYLLLNMQVQFKLNIYSFTTFYLFYIQNVFQHQHHFLTYLLKFMMNLYRRKKTEFHILNVIPSHSLCQDAIKRPPFVTLQITCVVILCTYSQMYAMPKNKTKQKHVFCILISKIQPCFLPETIISWHPPIDQSSASRSAQLRFIG